MDGKLPSVQMLPVAEGNMVRKWLDLENGEKFHRLADHLDRRVSAASLTCSEIWIGSSGS